MEAKFYSFLFGGLLLNVILSASCIYCMPKEESTLAYSTEQFSEESNTVITTPPVTAITELPVVPVSTEEDAEDTVYNEVSVFESVSNTAVAASSLPSDQLIMNSSSLMVREDSKSVDAPNLPTLPTDLIKNLIRFMKTLPSSSSPSSSLSSIIEKLERVLATRTSTSAQSSLHLMKKESSIPHQARF